MFQEIPETSRGPTPLGHTMELFSKETFQSQHTKAEHAHAMADHEPECGNHSRQRDIPRNDREKDHDTDEEYEEVKILPEHLAKCHKDKKFQKVMEILLNKEKEKYFLKLAQEGARLPHHFNIETIIMSEEETKMSKLEKQLKIM